MNAATWTSLRNAQLAPLRWALGIWLLGLILAVALSGRAQVSNDARRADKFQELADRVVLDVRARMQRYEYGLRGARGAVIGAGGSSINRLRFEAYARSRDIDREFPGARGFGYIRRVSPAHLNDFLAQAQAEFNGPFRLRQFAPHTGDLYVIHYIEPSGRNREANGLDLASEPTRKAAADSAMKSGEPTLSGPITLVQASGARSRGMLLLLPVYRADQTPFNEAERLQATEGWAYAPLLIDEVIGNLALMDRHYGLRIRDVTAAPSVQFFQSARDPELTASTQSLLHVRQDLQMFGRRWELELQSTPEFEQDLSLTPAHVPGLLTVVVSSLLSALVYALLAHWSQLARLNEQQARLATMAASANDAIIGTDLQGTITEWNDAASRMLGQTRPQALGQSMVRLLAPPYLRPQAEQHMKRALEGQRVPPTDFVCLKLDGTLLDVSLTLAPVMDSPGKVMGCAITIRDITPQKIAAERILALNATLEQQVLERTAQAEAANRAKSAFLATMSHEIRTPMNALNGMAYLLGKSSLDERQRQYVATLQDACKDLLHIVDNVLDLSKIEAGQISLTPQPFRVTQLVDDVNRLFAANAQTKGLYLVTQIDDGLAPELMGDPGRLKQMLSNLVGNAIKFTTEGGIAIEAQVAAGPDTASDPNVDLWLRVKDTGIGMSADTLQRLFTPYQQGHHDQAHNYGGTGLGLSIVKTLAELMGGEVGVRSVLGSGSEFWMRIPCAPVVRDGMSAEPNAPSHSGFGGLGSPIGHQRLTGARILVVDDSEVNALIARQILLFEQADVRVETDARQAVTWLIDHPNDIDLVLMDVQMPEMDGREATRQLRAQHPDKALPILALSAGVTEQERLQALQAGMNDFISKPFEAAQLVEAVSQWLRPRAQPDTHLSRLLDAARRGDTSILDADTTSE